MELILFIVGIVIFVVVLRLLGAWMLRINAVLDNQRTTIKQLETLNQNLAALNENTIMAHGIRG